MVLGNLLADALADALSASTSSLASSQASVKSSDPHAAVADVSGSALDASMSSTCRLETAQALLFLSHQIF